MVKLKIINVDKPYAEIIFDHIKNGYQRESEYKRKLENNYQERIEKALEYEELYLEVAKSGELHTLKPINDFFGLTKTEMSLYFDSRFESKEKLLEEGHICPICDGPISDTLDHVLPKNSYIQYTLIPINLVPMCGSCNRKKGTYIGEKYEESPFHPYFEDIDFKDYAVGKLTNNPSDFAPVEIIINQDVPSSHSAPLLKKYTFNYYKIFELYEIYNSYAKITFNNLIETLRKYQPVSKLTFVKIQVILEKEVEKYKGREFEKFNQEYIRYLVYKTLHEEFDEKIYNVIKNKLLNYEEELVEF